jgi:cytochrome c-type biogenesis protein CcmH/NrfF
MTVNPLVNWVWVGLAVMVIGCIISMLPESMFAFSMSKVPAGAATASMLMLMLAMPAPLRAAQEPRAADGANRSEVEKKLEGELMCMCGCMRPMNDCPMEPNCHGLTEQRAKIDKLLDAGLDHDAVLAAFVKDYGSQEVLAAPIDKGFNRLAWLFPYLLGGVGAVAIAIAARRWSRRESDSQSPAPTDSQDDALTQRLDDELRDLD